MLSAQSEISWQKMGRYGLYGFVTVYLVFCAVMYSIQRSVLYQPDRISSSEFDSLLIRDFGAAATVLPQFGAVLVQPNAGQAIQGTAIFYHGNDHSLFQNAPVARQFLDRGYRLVLAEYPGFGARAGEPTERALVTDSDHLYAQVASMFPHEPITVVGESLGTGVAVQVSALAKERGQAPAALVLITPFTSAVDVAENTWWMLPTRWLMKDRFESKRWLDHYDGPVAVVVAGSDEVVGADQGFEMYQKAIHRGKASVLTLHNALHDDWVTRLSSQDWSTLLAVGRDAVAPIDGHQLAAI
ncbi:MAG: alpha/beta hydrolase [Burkholderiales bacterium]|nr:alpha/beta hydrolase [Burkholderiales bacterium]